MGRRNVLHQRLGISSGDIGSAVAACIVHDAIVNGLGLDGFPGVEIDRAIDTGFKVTISFASIGETFSISDAEAKAAVSRLKTMRLHDATIFDRVQEAVATVEGRWINRGGEGAA